MANYEIDFCVIKGGDGKIVGLSLVAQPQVEAEMFCASFPKAILDKKGDIVIEGETIIFKLSDKETCSFNVSRQDAEALDNLLNDKGEYQDKKLGIYRDGFLTPGFKIILEGMQDFGKKEKEIQPVGYRC